MRFCPVDGTPLVMAMSASAWRALVPAREQHFPNVGDLVAERYKVLGQIGQGGMGVVFRVEHIVMAKRFALKVLHPRYGSSPHAVRRFEREARAASFLDHPNICMVTDFGTSDDGLPFIAMEHLMGMDLFDVLRDVRRFSPVRSVHIARQIAAGLSDAHLNGVIHRDLKPENIFLCSDREVPDFVKLLDFGIAKLVVGADGPPLTAEGEVPGTPEYFSPEQAAGGSADHRSDLYMVGLILYRMVTGFLPFAGADQVALIQAQLHERPRAIGSYRLPIPVPRALDKIIMKLLHKNPDRRFQTAKDVGVALAQSIPS
jgi:serine/threonine-protein kinase